MNAHPPECRLSYVEQYLEPVRHLLTDENVNELTINPDDSIYVERSGAAHMEPVDIRLSAQAIRRLGAQIAGETKNQLGPAHPIVSGRVRVWGQPQRVQVVVEPAIEAGVSLSIRKYSKSTLDLSVVKFVGGAQVSIDDERVKNRAKIQELSKQGKIEEMFLSAIEQRMNILVSGGTSSGKTTLTNAILAKVAHDERIITIEDAKELYPPHGNYVGLMADRRENSERSPSKLLESCLRMRPDRIIVGEIRGVEAYDFLESVNTGHPGAISTIHADSPTLAFDRLAMMVLRAGVQMSHGEILDYARKSIDVVVQVGRRDGKRGVLEVYLPGQDED